MDSTHKKFKIVGVLIKKTANKNKNEPTQEISKEWNTEIPKFQSHKKKIVESFSSNKVYNTETLKEKNDTAERTDLETKVLNKEKEINISFSKTDASSTDLSQNVKNFSYNDELKADLHKTCKKIVKFYLEIENKKGFNDINLLGLNKEMALLFARGRLSNIEKYEKMNQKTLVYFKNYSGNAKKLIFELNTICKFPLLVEEVLGNSTVVASFSKTANVVSYPSPKETQISVPLENINSLWKRYDWIRKNIEHEEVILNFGLKTLFCAGSLL